MSVRLQKNKKTLNFVIFINRKCSPLKTKQNNQTFQGKIFIFFKLFQGRWPLRTPLPPSTFKRSKQWKEEKQKEKRKSFKVQPIKRLSSRSKCFCFSYPRASRIQKRFLVGIFSIPWPHPLWNPFPGPVFLNIYTPVIVISFALHVSI